MYGIHVRYPLTLNWYWALSLWPCYQFFPAATKALDYHKVQEKVNLLTFQNKVLFGGRISCKKLHNYDYRKKPGGTVLDPVCMQQLDTAVPKD